MGLLKEFKIFVKTILSWVYLLLGFSFFFFLFPRPIDSLAVQVFNLFQRDLLPEGVQLIVTNPLSAFLAQMQVSFLMAFIVTLPFFLYNMIKYLLPALLEKERKIIFKILFPSSLLFFLGCLFAYFLLIPVTFAVLYPYALAIGAVPFFSVAEFIVLVFGLMLVVGIMFLMPVFMVFLSSLGIIKPVFWKNNQRIALLLFLIFSAIITPDGTGISMIILSVPLVGLYFLGTFITIQDAKKTKGRNLINNKT